MFPKKYIHPGLLDIFLKVAAYFESFTMYLTRWNDILIFCEVELISFWHAIEIDPSCIVNRDCDSNNCSFFNLIDFQDVVIQVVLSVIRLVSHLFNK